jgi:hypothetical protein
MEEPMKNKQLYLCNALSLLVLCLSCTLYSAEKKSPFAMGKLLKSRTPDLEISAPMVNGQPTVSSTPQNSGSPTATKPRSMTLNNAQKRGAINANITDTPVTLHNTPAIAHNKIHNSLTENHSPLTTKKVINFALLAATHAKPNFTKEEFDTLTEEQKQNTCTALNSLRNITESLSAECGTKDNGEYGPSIVTLQALGNMIPMNTAWGAFIKGTTQKAINELNGTQGTKIIIGKKYQKEFTSYNTEIKALLQSLQ